MTVRELEERMDADELADWIALRALEEEEAAQRDLVQTIHHELAQARQE